MHSGIVLHLFAVEFLSQSSVVFCFAIILILSLGCPGDMFAGVGPIAVVAAEKVKFVYANDLNPTATSYMQHNLSLNKLAYKAEV